MAWRLIFEAVGDELRVVRAQRVEMEAPAPPVEMPEGHGVFAEIRDADEKTLYRADLSSQLFRGTEVFAPDGSVTRDATGERRLAMVVIPDRMDATHVVVIRGEKELVRASLDKREE